jgi:ribosomal protein S12 methylthiotransferase
MLLRIATAPRAIIKVEIVPRKKPPTVALVSLGCPKNLVDSERMLAALALAGMAITPDADGADLAIVNTCAFIDLARAESDEHIDALEALKAAGRLRGIVVAGCMAQRYAGQILARHPAVDAVVGVGERESLAEVCLGVLAGDGRRPPAKSPSSKGCHGLLASRAGGGHAGERNAAVHVGPMPTTPPDDRERLRLTPRHYAYLRISEGCDNRCAYCAIPEIRGPLHSKPPQLVLAEVAELAADGAKELIIIGQDTTAYGRDFTSRAASRKVSATSSAECGVRSAELREEASLGGLLGLLRKKARVPWIRIMYAHPASFGDDVIEQLAAGLPVVPYVDLPLQHASDPILKSMGRRTTRAKIARLITKLHRAVPHVAIRTSFIVGYPGETARAFDELFDFVQEVRFDHVGVFVYSPEAGTRAAGLPDQVPMKTARARWDRLMELAQSIAAEAAKARVGQTLEVLVDGAGADGRLIARHAGQAPDVDSAVLLPAGSARAGHFVNVRITGTEGYDLVAVVEGSSKFKVLSSRLGE